MSLVQRFLAWAATAPVAKRSEAAGALARAYLHAGRDQQERAEMAAAMAMLAGDGSRDVRRSLAEALARSADAPAETVRMLAADVPRVALSILVHSPLLGDADLVDLVSTRDDEGQAAIAAREHVSAPVAAAIAAIAAPSACAMLARNPGARLTASTWACLIERFGDHARIRALLLERGDVPVHIRQGLAVRLSQELGGMAQSRFALAGARATALARDSGERATLEISRLHGAEQLVGHLRESGQLTAGLVLRALFCGNLEFVAHALAELSGQDVARVARVLAVPRSHGFRALYRRTGMPEAAFAIFCVGADHLDEDGDGIGTGRLCRRALEHAVSVCGEDAFGAIGGLMRGLLQEAVRNEAAEMRDLMTTPLRLRAA